MLVQLAAIAFMDFALGTEDQVFENPENPAIAIYYILLVLGFTAIFLILIKYNRENLIRTIFFISIGFVIFFVAATTVAVFSADERVIMIIGTLIGAASVLAIWRYPEWYVIDSIGIVMSIGIVALLGISLSILPVLILLIGLAIYDAISVYRTKHMLTLADGVADMGLPILLVVPKKLPYSCREKNPLAQRDMDGEREAFIMGLGDVIIPGLLPASAFWFLSSEKLLFEIPGNFFVAVCTIIGALMGLLILMRMLSRGDPHHAGLPFLNLGAIMGYFISYFAVFGADLSGMI